MEVDWTRTLHNGGQIDAFHDDHRFKILACGTRWGKTRLCANIVIDKAIKKKIEVWWVAPTYDLGDRGLGALYESAPRELFGQENKVKRILPMVSGSNIQFKTADNPVSLLGKGIDFLVIDEAARIKDDIWHRYLRRTLLDHKGGAIFISTPHGKNYFYELWLKGNDSDQIEFQSWQFPTSANPLIDPLELRKAENDVPDLIWRQEYLAEFLEAANQVFRNITNCIRGELEQPIRQKWYVLGVDLAKYQDFTVLSVLDQNGHLVYWDRFNQLDWGFQKTRIKGVAAKYNAQVIIDSTGLGDPIYDDLYNAGLNVEGFRITSASKRQLIENLSMQLEQGQISFPKIDQIINELQAFECNIGASNNLQYSAPCGFFDDCVISLALAAWYSRRVVTGDLKVVGKPRTMHVERQRVGTKLRNF